MAKKVLGHNHKTIVATIEKYEQQTGVALKDNMGVIPIVQTIAGKKGVKIKKINAWNFMIKYCKGEDLATLIKQITVVNKPTKIKSGNKKMAKKPNNNFTKPTYNLQSGYSHDKAVEFYKSREWRELRVEIIEGQKGECQMCGRSHKKHGITIHVDHIVPLSKNWARRLDKTNLQLLCEDCNLGKSNHYSTDWRQ